MLTLQQIISEADLLVANTVELADKIMQLNAINQDFFNTVKIPVFSRFNGVSGQQDYALESDIRQKNIDLVQVGLLRYNSLDNASVNPAQNAYAYDDDTGTLTLSPAPYQTGIACLLRYRRIATSNFTTASLSAIPDAPAEYHWTYVPALASWLAKAEDEMNKAKLYEAQFTEAWNRAMVSYSGGAAQ